MASIGHVIVGLAAARWSRRREFSSCPPGTEAGGAAAWPALAGPVGWSALALLPDADVVGFSLGVRYSAPWGHRGATHSLVFALAMGAVVGLLALLARRPALRTGLLAAAVVASHGLLDALTDGGLGAALLWPFSDERFFAPITPLPVAPIGIDFLSPKGIRVATTELAFFAPLLIYAVWPTAPRRRPTPA
jgi:inner membrane protein